MASSVVSDNFETSSGAIPNIGGADVTTRFCSAWVNFNGSSTVAIRASYNVSSITDNGVGDYTINFTDALSSANYVLLGTAAYGAISISANRILGIWDNNSTTPPTTTTCRIATIYSSETRQDVSWVCASIFS